MNTYANLKHAESSMPEFRYAPEGWSRNEAEELANQEGIYLTESHWLLLTALQEYFARHEEPNVRIRELHDALDEKFHSQGGMKFLYELFPGGPVAQGGLLAGIKRPAGTSNKSFGSVQ